MKLSNNPAVNHKQPKTFYIESPTFLARREVRSGESEHQIRRDIETFEPWRLPVTITEVSHD
ncbi:hypothetical protein [Marinobacter salarius]|uniref:hypothetical protein n=1 Tax=Marinobacter salarius TaxID=1420917 RepID=UPI00241DE5D9|nr:hypothetical protein [Marinobacter salarius]